MEIVILPDPQQVGEYAADRVLAALDTRDPPVLGLATGSSPLDLYASLGTAVNAGRVDLSRVRGFALDEYVGIAPGHPQSYARVIRETVVDPLRMDPALVAVPDGNAADIQAACADYERRIEEAGGIDVQILGIGSNGHIGFNEPTSSFASRTRIKTLAEATRADNARFFADDEPVPTHCVTQGLGTILDARSVVLVATGSAKAEAVAAMVEGPVSARWPASVLQHHRNVVVVVDEAAAVNLTLAGYYRYTFANKPV